jgi:hypothetical protein
VKNTKNSVLTMSQVASLTAAVCAVSLSSCEFVQSTPDLGEADQFAELAGTTVTKTGSSVVTGELGVSPGTAMTGFPPGIVQMGEISSNDAITAQAVADLLAA